VLTWHLVNLEKLEVVSLRLLFSADVALTSPCCCCCCCCVLTWQLVNLAKLEVVSLLRYRRVFQLAGPGPAAERDELLHAVSRHFAEQVRQEEE
jgi:hypothetical protein